MKEKSGKQEIRGTEIARKIAKERRRGLKKGNESDSEQCHEVERVKQKGDDTIPNNGARERRRNTQINGLKSLTKLYLYTLHGEF